MEEPKTETNREEKTENKIPLRKRHPVIFWVCAVVEGIAVAQAIISTLLGGNLFQSLFLANLLALPLVLTVVNVYLIFIKPKDDPAWKKKVRRFEWVSAIVGFILSMMAMNIGTQYVDWHTPVPRGDHHSPVWLRAAPTVVIPFLIGIAGYMVLARTHAKKTPPLVTVLALSALYIGVFECVMWGIQVWNGEAMLPFFSILPINCVIIAGRLIREKAYELKAEGEAAPCSRGGIVGWLNQQLQSGSYPAWALVLAFPLMGAVIVILLLFGQRPEDIIKAYTETADWTFSQRIAPPDLDHDYLCTVAAQGHARLVRPQRVGVRHGRKLLVNRQLSIANAFEQVLEERTPRLHKAIRRFYDAYGYPLSKRIKTKAAADLVYLAMKPLEWAFLITLYLLTVNPEARIAKQYLG